MLAGRACAGRSACWPGAYPAFYLSSWAPLTALTGKQTGGKGSLRLREALVLVQFTISAAVIACTLLMGAQMRYVANKSLGFEKENRLVVTMRGAPTIDKHDTIKSELLKDSHILGVAIAAAPPQMPGTPVNLAQVEQEDGKTEPTQLNNFPIGEGYIDIMGIKVLQGRDLSKRLLTDVGTNVLVNEAMVRKMGWTNPLGKRMVVRGEARPRDRRGAGLQLQVAAHQDRAVGRVSPQHGPQRHE